MDEGKLEGYLKRGPEQLVLKKHLFEVCKSHPFGVGQDVVLRKCQIQRGKERNGGKYDETDDKRKDKHVPRHIVPIQQSAAFVFETGVFRHDNGSFHRFWGDFKKRAEGAPFGAIEHRIFVYRSGLMENAGPG